MAQNAQASPVTNISGQTQASQAGQYYGSPQLTQIPFPYMMNTPNFYGQGFIPPATPSPPPSSDILSSILERLNSVDKKLSQLDQIHQTVSGIVLRIDNIEQRMNSFETRMKELEKSCDFSGNMIENITKKQSEFDSTLKSTSNLQSRENSVIQHEHKLQAEITDLKCRSMRDNLLFFKIPEEQEEQCDKKILEFIETKLHVQNAQTEIKLHRAHRIGRYQPNKVRPIVAKFAYYPDKERVRRESRELKGTPFGISEQYPQEVMEARRRLVPIMKKARSEGKEAYLRIDKLYINKQVYKE
ncbi:uncharacterized protein LOC127852388 [Dreissena polymorpha]|uniref:uncharacterized protein LOC127852388 n=1 Tax=Dreissena polymorpha TaxID=45954 RepID=UPI002264674C|nr:uncharacterized protein LOC127852388 [Dreissena polymorpha]